MNKTIYKINKMDCPSEENLIKLKLNELKEVIYLDFDLNKRLLTVYHNDKIELIEKALEDLNFERKIVSTELVNDIPQLKANQQRKILWIVLFINFSFFLIEIISGLISNSMGLVADSLDMLADAFVYGISIYAIGGTTQRKKNIAKIAGYFQITLAIIGFIEVLRRFLGIDEVPNFQTMILVSLLALLANSSCLYLLIKSKSKEAHISASMIFTSNDVIINIGVIVAGILVLKFNSPLPDLIVGVIVFLLVIYGAKRILNLSH